MWSNTSNRHTETHRTVRQTKTTTTDNHQNHQTNPELYAKKLFPCHPNPNIQIKSKHNMPRSRRRKREQQDREDRGNTVKKRRCIFRVLQDLTNALRDNSDEKDNNDSDKTLTHVMSFMNDIANQAPEMQQQPQNWHALAKLLGPTPHPQYQKIFCGTLQ